MEYSEHTKNEYYEIIGKNSDGNIVMLDYTFDHGSFRGATGTVFGVVTAESAEYWLDDFEENQLDFWRQAVSMHETIRGLSDWVNDNWSTDAEKIAYMLDDSYSYKHEDIREAYDIPESSFITCTGGGRIFPQDIEWLPGMKEKYEDLIISFEGK